MADLVQANLALEERMDKHGSRLYKLENLNIPHQVSKAVDEIVTDAVDWAIQAPLRDHFRDLSEADMKEILHHRMWETNSYQAHEDHKQLYEALEKSMAHDHTDQLLSDLAEARKKKKKRHDSPKTPLGSPPHQPPPPPPAAGPSGTSRSSRASGLSHVTPPPPPLSTNQNDPSKITDAPSSSKKVTSTEYTAWTKTNSRIKPFVSSIPEELHMDDDTTLDDQTGGKAIFNVLFCKKQRINELKQQDLEGLAYEIVKVFHPNVIHLQYQMEECHKLLHQTWSIYDTVARVAGYIVHLEDEGAYYPDVGLEQMVPDQMWIKEECKYDIAAIAVKTHMRILSVVRIEVFSLYGYDYMKKIVLRRADLKEYTIAERDFKYLYPVPLKI
ncbi:hypothetical protein Tco_0917654 [Tanacetum coccineum]